MKEKLQFAIFTLKQKQDANEALEKEFTNALDVRNYYVGKRHAFAEAAQLITDILNSENPNSVSNQPTEE